jgi:hypothetical protein
MLLGLVFIVLLAVEWRYRFRVIRVGAAVLALLVWFFMLPDAYRAFRRAMLMPPAERTTQLPGVSRPFSEYEIGVVTMWRAVADDAEMDWNERLMAIGVLTWLACSPAFRRERALPIAESSAHAHRG